MKSVDALRKWADGLSGIWIDPNDHSIIVTTCDDMVPSMDCVSLREYVNGILDNIEREVADMVRLPVDADGEPIHVGDWIDVGGSKKMVDAVTPDAVYWWEEDGCHWVHGHMVVRHRTQTVEDVLREFADRYLDYEGMPSAGRRGIGEAMMAEYAAKLRLAGDE